MPIQNSDVAGIFEKVADFLEIEGENRFRVRAYRYAARTVGGHSRSVAEMVTTRARIEREDVRVEDTVLVERAGDRDPPGRRARKERTHRLGERVPRARKLPALRLRGPHKRGQEAGCP